MGTFRLFFLYPYPGHRLVVRPVGHIAHPAAGPEIEFARDVCHHHRPAHSRHSATQAGSFLVGGSLYVCRLRDCFGFADLRSDFAESRGPQDQAFVRPVLCAPWSYPCPARQTPRVKSHPKCPVHFQISDLCPSYPCLAPWILSAKYRRTRRVRSRISGLCAYLCPVRKTRPVRTQLSPKRPVRSRPWRPFLFCRAAVRTAWPWTLAKFQAQQKQQPDSQVVRLCAYLFPFRREKHQVKPGRLRWHQRSVEYWAWERFADFRF